MGNRLNQYHNGTLGNQSGSYVYDQNDRLISESRNSVAITYTHDANGNQLTKREAGVITSEFRWDEENRLIGSTLGSGPTQKVISYSYDPNGIRRAQEEVSGGNRKRTEYLVDPNQAYAQVLEEWTASGASSTALPDQTLAKSYVFGDDLISQTIAATTSFYHYDGLGTTRALSNSAGVVTDRYAYSAFGEEDPAGSWNTTSTDNTYRYTGEQLDPNLGFYYLRARYMDPSRGGFVGMDSYLGSSQDPQSLHKYLYAHANPVMGTDPSGMFTLSQMGATLNVLGHLVAIGLPTYNAVGNIRAGMDIGSVTTRFAAEVTIGYAGGALLGGLLRYVPGIVRIRPIGSLLPAGGRASNSMWNAGIAVRGAAAETAVLGGQRSLPWNYPVIDDFTGGFATSIKSMDLIGKSPTYIRSQMLRSADALSAFVPRNYGAGGQLAGLPVNGRNLVYVFEPGAADAAQAVLLKQIAKEMKATYPDIKLAFQWVP